MKTYKTLGEARKAFQKQKIGSGFKNAVKAKALMSSPFNRKGKFSSLGSVRKRFAVKAPSLKKKIPLPSGTYLY